MSAGPPLPVDLWDSLSREARALIRTRQAEAAELRAKVRSLRQQVHDLQERLNQNSTNSTRPPSTDLSTVKRRPPREGGQLLGRQLGHGGFQFVQAYDHLRCNEVIIAVPSA